FSLTSVQHLENDTVGKVLALVTLSPIFICVMYATLLVFNRDLQIFVMSFGQMLNVVLNEILKQVINQPRPGVVDRHDSGMPSNHAQFLFFFAAYFSLSMRNRISGPSVAADIFVTAGVHVLAILTAYSRVYLSYHTVPQVLVGSAVGSIMGIFWSFIAKVLHASCISKIPNSKVGELLLLKDYSQLSDIPSHEY
ncbi:unnamed protein product, partial [Heterosigma akashiwo]